jgi:SAM-dependent methyltransferase
MWGFDVGGEVWSVACSDDASIVVVGAGDGFVHVLQQRCTSAVSRELLATKASFNASYPAEKERWFVDMALGARCVDVLLDVFEQAHYRREIDHGFALEVLERATGSGMLSNEELLRVARLFADLGDCEQSVAICQRLSESSDYPAQALSLAGRCFEDMRLPDAAESCYRRATESFVNKHSVRLLYDLARDYEDRNEIALAIQHYELLVSWDIAFRDARRRLELLRATRSGDSAYDENLGYTGLTALLGPDVPTDVDRQLVSVIEARTAELAMTPEERRSMIDALQTLGEQSVFDSAGLPDLPYDTVAYLRYEHSPAEDTVKKHLEMINLVASTDLSQVGRALDIGTATCRYPLLFDRMGIGAVGLDQSRAGFEYMRGRGMPFSSFVNGDGRTLPFASGSFDLVTCMMGTLNHLERVDRVQVLNEAFRVLKFGGVAVCSIWDTSCPYQSFLTMYSTNERLLFRNRPLLAAGLVELLRAAGFVVSDAKRFCCFPDQLVYDLGAMASGPQQIRRLVEVDIAARAKLPMAPGQMVLVVCSKQTQPNSGGQS